MMLSHKTELALSGISKNIPQSLIFYGDTGADFSSAINYLYQNKKNIISINPQKNEAGGLLLSVSQIRDLLPVAYKKHNDKSIIIFYGSELMTKQAQNALLKIFEEPPENTYFLLICNNLNKLLDTIRSRAQLVRIYNLNSKESEFLINQKREIDKTKSKQIEFIADGKSEFINELLDNKKTFNKHSTIMHDAKIFLQGTTSEKILLINKKYKDDRGLSRQLILYIIKMIKILINKNPLSEYVAVLNRAIKTDDKIQSNCNVRLAMLYFVVEWIK